MLNLLLANFLLALVNTKVGCFNVDTNFPIILSGPPKSYFGYSVALDASKSLLVGAPRANNTIRREVFEPGSLFSCPTDGRPCEEMELHGLEESDKRILFGYRAWFGGTVLNFRDHNERIILACAHRCQPESTTGACLSINSPTHRSTWYRTWYLQSPLDGDLANAQFGMSAVVSELGEFHIGAPGLFKGTGYSVATGKFYNSKQEISVTGSPRDENFGKVYISVDVSNGEGYHKVQEIKGFQFGEYFGSSVLGVDLNGDSFSDLMVGAPLYSVDTGCDEGKVYVFLSDGTELNYFTDLVGDQKADARFGTALAKIGDLNQDGFQDVAVGAPYEDGNGAVYIYLGSETGIKDNYFQKIEASKINPALSGFGIHISGGQDVDGNGYPDMAVGSYLSSNVVLLRSLPVIEVSLKLLSNENTEIRMNHADCLYKNKTTNIYVSLPCYKVLVYLKYTGHNVPHFLDFQCSLIEGEPNPRGFFISDDGSETAAVLFNRTANYNDSISVFIDMFFRSEIKDTVTPIPVSLSCDLAPLRLDTQHDASNMTYFSHAVVSPSSILHISKLIPFHNGCESEEECYCDLVVTAELEGTANGSVITLGSMTSLTLNVTVLNEGEPAFLPQLLIKLLPEIPVINMDFCEAGYEKQKGIKCELGNQLPNNKSVSFHFKLDMTKIPPHTKEIVITLECTTNSTEVNPEDNVATLTLGVQTISDFGIRGITSHSLVLYHETEEISSTIKHKYTVKNHGPSPLHSINIFLQVPNAIFSSHGRTEFLIFTGLETDSQSEMTLSTACNSSYMEKEMFLPPVEVEDVNATFIYENDSFSSDNIRKRDLGEYHAERFHFQPDSQRGKASLRDEKWSHVLSCDTKDVECVTIQCSSSPFTDLRKFAEVSVAFQIDFSVIHNHFESWSHIEFISTASLSSPDNDVIILLGHPKISRVKTVFLDVRYKSRDVPHWLYFTSIIIGLMLLLQVVLVLIKVGFFERKENNCLNRLKQSFYEADIDEKLLIDPSEKDDLTD